SPSWWRGSTPTTGSRNWTPTSCSPRSLVSACRRWSTRTTWSSRRSTRSSCRPGDSSSERLVEGHLAADRDLVGRDPALEEVGELLHVLKVHEAEGVLGPEAGGEAEGREAPVRDELQVAPHVSRGKAGDAEAQHVVGEGGLAGDGLLDHLDDRAAQLGVQQRRLLAPHGVDHREGEGHVAALVPEDPVGAGREAVEQ